PGPPRSRQGRRDSSWIADFTRLFACVHVHLEQGTGGLMPRINCQCGESLSVPADGPERIVCPKCGARIRVRRPGSPAGPGDGDGFVRFTCPCGRRLKVRAEEGKEIPESGKCPDCGRIVPVPTASTLPASNQTLPTSHPEAVTEE